MTDLDLHFMMIGLEVCRVTSEKPLPEPCRLIDHMTDDDRREGIRRYFSGCDEECTEEDVEHILRGLKNWESEQERARKLADAIVSSLMPSLRW